jgi:hypothetical protein
MKIDVRYLAASIGHKRAKAVTREDQTYTCIIAFCPGQRHFGSSGQGQGRTADLPLFSMKATLSSAALMSSRSILLRYMAELPLCQSTGRRRPACGGYWLRTGLPER